MVFGKEKESSIRMDKLEGRMTEFDKMLQDYFGLILGRIETLESGKMCTVPS